MVGDVFNYYRHILLTQLRLIVIAYLIPELHWYNVISYHIRFINPLVCYVVLKNLANSDILRGVLSRSSYSLANPKYRNDVIDRSDLIKLTSVYLLESKLDINICLSNLSIDCNYYRLSVANKSRLIVFVSSIEESELEEVRKRLYS